MTELERLADLVRTERRRRHWGQQQLADAAGVSLGTINNFERKKTLPQPGNLRAILRILGLEQEGGDETASNTRGQWPQDVKTFLDIMGLFLTALPEDERTELIHDLTRQIVTRR